jgi:hypothetical protein
MTCPDCAKAAQGVWHGYSGNCKGCVARGVSRLPQTRKARDSGDKFDRDYRRLLEQAGVTHNEVLAAAKADALNRKGAA